MEGDIDKKLKQVLKPDKKGKKGKKSKKVLKEVKVKIGVYAGRRGPYKLYKIKDGQLVAIKTRRRIKGGATEDDVDEVEVDDNTYKLPDLDDHEFNDEDAEIIKEEVDDKKIKDAEIVKTVEIKPTKKRVQTAKQKEWMDYVARISLLPCMKGKSRAYVMKEASRMRKAE